MTDSTTRLRLLQTADLHIGTPLKRFDRVDEQMANLQAIFAEAIAQQCQVVAIAGDLFWDKLANAQFSMVTHRLMEAFLPYVQQGGTIVAISGNHDSPMQFRALQSAIRVAAAAVGVRDAEARVRFVTDPSVIMLPGGVQAVCLPYPVKEHAIDLVPKGTPAAEIAAARNQAVVRQIGEDYRTLLATLDDTQPAITLAHFHVETARMPAQVGEGFEHSWDRDFQVPKRLLIHPRISFIGLGHIHEMQSLDPAMWYAGAPTVLNSSEAGTQKGVLIVDVPATGYARVTPAYLPCATLKVFRLKSSGLEATLAGLSSEDRERTYLKFSVTMDDALTRKSVRGMISKTVRRHFGIEILEPRTQAVDAARVARPSGVRLNTHDIEHTVRQHLVDVCAADPDLADLLVLADDCILVARSRGDWTHHGGLTPTATADTPEGSPLHAIALSPSAIAVPAEPHIPTHAEDYPMLLSPVS